MSNLEFQMSEVSNDMIRNKMYDFFHNNFVSFTLSNIKVWSAGRIKNVPIFYM